MHSNLSESKLTRFLLKNSSFSARSLTAAASQPPDSFGKVSDRSRQPTTPRFRRQEALVGIATLIAQRLAFGALVLATITYLSYLGLGMAQGLAFQPALARAAGKTAAYLGRLAQGDLGLSTAGSITLPVAEVLPATLSKSLGLLAAALLIAALVGVILGTWAALHRHPPSPPYWGGVGGWSLVTLLALSLIHI